MHRISCLQSRPDLAILQITADLPSNCGSKISAPADPNVQGYTFTSWYTDSACTQKYDFSHAVTENLILYAGWEASAASNVSSSNADSNRISPQTGVEAILAEVYVMFGGTLAVLGAAFASALFIRREFLIKLDISKTR